MTTPTLMPEFEVRPSVLVGERADAHLHRVLTILRNEGMNPGVTMDFTASRGGVLCGIGEARALLEKALPDTGAEVWAHEDGYAMSAGETVLRIKAPYSTFGLYEGTICGTLAACSGWATAARECVDAAAGVIVFAAATHYAHPFVAPLVEYAATVGGCVSVSTSRGAKLAGVTPTGYMGHTLPMLLGDTVRALQSYDRHMPLEVPRVIIIDTFKDEVEEALNAARALGDRLRGVNISTPPERGGVTPELVREVRAHLDLHGFQHVDIYATDGMTADRIRGFAEVEAPVSGYSVGEALAAAPPLAFSADILEIDERPVARRGRRPGAPSAPRLNRIK